MADDDDAAKTAARWRDEEAAVRARLGPPGIADREQVRRLSGLAFFEAMLKGDLPRPMIGGVIDFVPIAFERGRFVFQGTPKRDYYNPLGIVHGGIAATLLDSCVGCAIQTTLPAGKGYTTLELKVNYVRAMTEDTGLVRAEGKVVSAGNQVGVAEGRLTDTRGRLLAFATTTCLIFPL